MESYMKLAIEKAKEGKTPFGAVIVRKGEILAAVYNTVREASDPTAHAEVNAIRRACQSSGSPRLKEAVLYTTCEPCPMCAAAAVFAGIDQIVYGADIPTIACYLPQIQLRAEEVLRHSEHKVEIKQVEEVDAYESLLQQFA
ncbi:MAG: nucleoside deaminase [Cyclobacteriaceae bacterium]